MYRFRILAAVMVVAIHIGPLSGVNKDADYLLTYCAGRTAVPFFLMTTGYFVIESGKPGGYTGADRMLRFLKKTMILYGISIVMYLPVNLYAGGLPHSPGELLRMLFFDGTFYHLWYFPAVLMGCILVMGLRRIFSERTVFVLAFLLYLVGTGGDSWFGLVSRIPGAAHFYDMIFAVSSYTRNGLFFAPVYLMLGASVRNRRERDAQNPQRGDAAGKGREAVLAAGLMISLVFMLGEGYLSYHLDMQRHNSMYLFLPPVMYFLFRLLLSVPGYAPGWTRDVSMIVYIIHPGVLIALRGIAGAAGLDWLLAENALVQFISVSVASFAAAVLIDLAYARIRIRKEAHENA